MLANEDKMIELTKDLQKQVISRDSEGREKFEMRKLLRKVKDNSSIGMSNKDKFLYSTIGILLGLLVLFIFLFINKRDNLNIAEHNIKSLNDTIRVEKLKNGELIEYKNSLIIEKSELEKYLCITNKEIKELERKLNEKVLYISKLEGEIRVDTLFLKDSVSTNDSITYIYHFNDINKYYQLSGYTEVDGNNKGNTVITNNTMKMKLKVGLDDDWKIFVTSDNPYITFSGIDGAVLDKDVYLKRIKQKKWGIGIQAGIGMQYGLIHKTFDVGPYIGVGISYNFITF